ncbi:MAG: hypothetical protein EOP41_02840, partial [Sphingobacteriaceae bacterium]
MKRKITLIVALIGTLISGYALGQQTADNDAFDQRIMEAESDLTFGEYKSARKGGQQSVVLNKSAVRNPDDLDK